MRVVEQLIHHRNMWWCVLRGVFRGIFRVFLQLFSVSERAIVTTHLKEIIGGTMEIISREEAKVNNLKRYYTGIPCRNGHFSERYVASGGCVECAKDHQKSHKERNPCSGKRISDADREYYIRMFDEDRARCVREFIEFDTTSRAKQNNEIGYSRCKSPHRCSEEHNDMMLAIYKECALRRIDGEDVEVDHTVPLNSEKVCGLHVPWNLRIIPTPKNREKSNKTWELM